MKPGGKKVIESWKQNVMRSVISFIIRSDVKEQIPYPEDIDGYKINFISHTKRQGRKRYENNLFPCVACITKILKLYFKVPTFNVDDLSCMPVFYFFLRPEHWIFGSSEYN